MRVKRLFSMEPDVLLLLRKIKGELQNLYPNKRVEFNEVFKFLIHLYYEFYDPDLFPQIYTNKWHGKRVLLQEMIELKKKYKNVKWGVKK